MYMKDLSWRICYVIGLFTAVNAVSWVMGDLTDDPPYAFIGIAVILFARALWLWRKERKRTVKLYAHSDGKLHREPEEP